MESPDPDTQERAALILWRMGEPGAGPLAEALKVKDR